MERQRLTVAPDSSPEGDLQSPPLWVPVRVRVPSDALDAPALIQRLKHAKKSVGYEDFVIARNGDPEIGEREFRRLLERLPPRSHQRLERVPFQPSWVDPEGRYYQLLWREGDTLRLLRDDGALGRCSIGDFEALFRPLQPGTGSDPDYPRENETG